VPALVLLHNYQQGTTQARKRRLSGSSTNTRLAKRREVVVTRGATLPKELALSAAQCTAQTLPTNNQVEGVKADKPYQGDPPQIALPRSTSTRVWCVLRQPVPPSRSTADLRVSLGLAIDATL
jgi:hypothetical protein